MNLYVFSSTTLTNIWAGVGARRWAVSAVNANRLSVVKKAGALRVGSLGVLYCSETRTLTVPFLVASVPREISVKDIWPEEWGLPFSIFPLGSPAKQMSQFEIQELPSIKTSRKRWNNVLFVQGSFAFQPSTISESDWEIIFARLADK